ncbi:helicase, DEAD/DEAH family protein [Plesiocystis pacifica SIR-1]|uniref:Helicase, DEAD/DEAH family protein n=1 Tax=Plesiocystis pacifica SIR-1 TaxID=391625 RepID=A6G0U4_9BACT|nr:HIT family protein [Plesiocystis pacifica]EDM80482.1 helicase, DEAD/DEAH family protein [Plesiocystis pacifica SIR-1]
MDDSPVDGCVFCHNTRERVFDSARVYAIADAFPVSPGHTLVISKRHVPSYFELDEAEQREMWAAVATVQRELSRRLLPGGFNVGFNVGAVAGQTIMHAHIHVIPRFHGDMEDPRGGVRGVIPGKQKYG